MLLFYRFSLYLILIATFTVSGYAQRFSAAFVVKNIPEHNVALGLVNGDDIIPVDSCIAKNELVRFNFPEDAARGIYRLNLGQTGYARIMQEDPQILDFIFNGEDIVIETDFNSPEQSVNVMESKENQIWYRFKKRELSYYKEMEILEKEVDHFWSDTIKSIASDAANNFNHLQLEHDQFLTETAGKCTECLVSDLIMAARVPLKDGYLSKQERNKQFQEQFFNLHSYDNEALIYSQAYTDNLFLYLISYNKPNFSSEERKAAYKIAIDRILENISINDKVFTFLLNYLKHGFEVLGYKELVHYIEEKETR